ncbi:MAG: phosphopantothenoylcysteine decarboxylase [Candidatus Omnitrophica bacterium]|nr:phosphopantothenoylcysteine decarboxylase [Candidatus Omnitrophota bacterium]
MKKVHLLITAGPTREPLDPVRFISNYSTGTLGYILAEEAKKEGYSVTLISGPTHLKPPQGVKFIAINTASEMYKEVKKHFSSCDCLIMTAAVCDFRVVKPARNKIKKGSSKNLILRLVKNPDILYEMGRRKKDKILIGFSLETTNLIKHAQEKLKKKNLDLIIAQKLGRNTFGEGSITPLIIYREGVLKKSAPCSKLGFSKRLLKEINTLTFKKLSAKLSQK